MNGRHSNHLGISKGLELPSKEPEIKAREVLYYTIPYFCHILFSYRPTLIQLGEATIEECKHKKSGVIGAILEAAYHAYINKIKISRIYMDFLHSTIGIIKSFPHSSYSINNLGCNLQY